MLIIFDLDDTLIDTSGSVTPFKMRQCLEAFVQRGLKIADFDAAFHRLLDINRKAGSSEEAHARFLGEIGGDAKWIQEAAREMTQPLPPDFVVSETPGAKEILQILAQKCPLALVTGGSPPFQLEKLEKAGIDKSFFSKMAIPKDSVKGPIYEGLIREFSLPSEAVWVCGDRVAMDLEPAHRLGCRTVHMRWGRGLQLETPKWVSHSICRLGELRGILGI